MQPRLALLDRGRQYRIYQHQSVPEIVASILRSRHEFEGYEFSFNLLREYPRREQVMQYGESDLAFITRILAEVGIWFRFRTNESGWFEVVEFNDDQRHYLNPGMKMPHLAQSGLASTGEDAVWGLQVSHQVVEKNIHFRAYDPRNAAARLDSNVDQSRGSTTTYGEAYHYAEPYTVLGDKFNQYEKLESESGYFYARLRHELYLNDRTRLSGFSSSAILAPAQIIDVTGNAPSAFKPGAVVTRLITRATRDSSFEARFEAIPFDHDVCFRPPLPAKPQIAGTIPARVTSQIVDDPYSDIDMEGRYRVNFLFDRDSWNNGGTSMWLRLARPYAGRTYGLHLPLICGTEVAVAFENGDPDRPYIAHALHDSRHPDHVTLDDRDYTRNVLRTPANNKLRMEDERGKEHVKLSTEFSGKSQLNLGHLVDAKKQKRGEGFELRSDGWGALRGGKGLFVSADEQPKAQGDVLNMEEAVAQLQQALNLAKTLAQAASSSGGLPADIPAQHALKELLNGLKAPGLVATAPAGIAMTTPASLQLSAGQNLTATAGDSADISVFKRFSVAAGEAISLFASKLGFKAIASHGPVDIQAQSDEMLLRSRQKLTIASTEDEVFIDARQGITLVSGGAYIKLKDGSVEIGAPMDLRIKNDRIAWGGAASLKDALKPWVLEDPQYKYAMSGGFRIRDNDSGIPMPFVPYRIEVSDGRELHGVTDRDGLTQKVYSNVPETMVLYEDFDQPDLPEEEEEEEELTDGITLRLGLFFDGTGNNQANAAATAQCRRLDLVSYSGSELENIQTVCQKYGFGGFDGTAFNNAPDNSYGNAPSNVVHLHGLYPDNITMPMKDSADTGYIKVYLEGIGTRSGAEDETFVGQGLGLGETGVVARVRQASDLVAEQLRVFADNNANRPIRRIEIDVFGFSRGAAAARHCANEFLKPGCGVFDDVLIASRFGLQKSFDPAVDVRINFIGLFDTVAAIANMHRADMSVADDTNYGVNLYLPPGCARQVIQLRAMDECRNNFSLNSVGKAHREIRLPGVHSDLGGGYLPRAREHIWLTAPTRATVPNGRRVEAHQVWTLAEKDAQEWRETGIAREGTIVVKAWPAARAPRGRDEIGDTDYWVTTVLDRQVRGELSLIYLRLMRELGVRHGIPFKNLDARPQWALPDELKPIAETILQQALDGKEVELNPTDQALLRARYIHQSAHWVPTMGMLISRPASQNRRRVYPDEPQKGYPQ
jgi:type VI secretion system secreted protein VgrG